MSSNNDKVSSYNETSIIRQLRHGENLYLMYSVMPGMFPYFSLKVAVTATAAVAKWARTLASRPEGWIFESLPRQTLVEKTCSDNSTAKPLEIGVSVMGLRR